MDCRPSIDRIQSSEKQRTSTEKHFRPIHRRRRVHEVEFPTTGGCRIGVGASADEEMGRKIRFAYSKSSNISKLRDSELQRSDCCCTVPQSNQHSMDGTAETYEATNIRRMDSEELKPSWISDENPCNISDWKSSLLGSTQSTDIETDNCKKSKRGESAKSFGKRRRTRWDELSERCKGGESVEDEKSGKRRKTRWDNAENRMKLLGPLHLPDFRNNVVQESETELDDLTTELEDIDKKLQDKPSNSELIERRQQVVSELIKNQPTFRTPPKYRSSNLFKKIYVPVKQYPSYNFVGLLLGPGGNTVKRMQSETGARIVLRGLGSSVRGTSHAFDNDDLHVRIESDNEESLDAAIQMVEKLLRPTNARSNDLKQAQLKELACLKQSCQKINTCYVCGEHQEHGCTTCDNPPNDTARDEALLQTADLHHELLYQG